MKISVIAAHELDASQFAQWSAIQHADVNLRSPYYRPEFTQWVARARRKNPIFVAVIEAENGKQGFFPFERSTWGRLLPVGGGFNDYHGIVASSIELSVERLLSACRGRYFSFNHLPMTQPAFAPYVRAHSASPVMELHGGWDAYIQRLCAAQNTKSPGILSTVRQSERRLFRDKGPLRFEVSEPSAQVLDWIMRTKSEQWKRTGGNGVDAFSPPWVRQLLASSLELTDKGFRGAICSLYAGDSLIAAHLGLRSHTTLHWWFPVYDVAYAYYQPGLVMLKHMAEQAQSQGIELIDLGRGTQEYKMRLKTDLIPLGEGAVSRPACIAQAVAQAKNFKARVKANSQFIRIRTALDLGHSCAKSADKT